MIPDWKLEKYLTGDLPEAEMQQIRELEETDEIFAGRVRMLREDAKAILKKIPFETLSAKAEERATDSRKYVVPLNYKIVQVAAAFIVAVGIFIAAMDFNLKAGNVANVEGGSEIQTVALADTEQGDVRIKGLNSRFEIWKKQGDSAVQLQAGDSVTAGDELQLRYAVVAKAKAKCFGLLFSMDGNGTLTVHIGQGNAAVELDPSSMKTLPFAYKLDDAPYFEKFFFLTSTNPFAVDASKLDDVFKIPGVEKTEMTLIKKEAK